MLFFIMPKLAAHTYIHTYSLKTAIKHKITNNSAVTIYRTQHIRILDALPRFNKMTDLLHWSLTGYRRPLSSERSGSDGPFCFTAAYYFIYLLCQLSAAWLNSQ